MWKLEEIQLVQGLRRLELVLVIWDIWKNTSYGGEIVSVM